MQRNRSQDRHTPHHPGVIICMRSILTLRHLADTPTPRVRGSIKRHCIIAGMRRRHHHILIWAVILSVGLSLFWSTEIGAMPAHPFQGQPEEYLVHQPFISNATAPADSADVRPNTPPQPREVPVPIMTAILAMLLLLAAPRFSQRRRS